MMALLLVVTFVIVVVTGPSGDTWRARRREREDRVVARVTYLPSSACRGGCPQHHGDYPCLCIASE